ncbi:MAG: hypothetical protein AAFX76_13220, partial [Planctomycetota bacterium]
DAAALLDAHQILAESAAVMGDEAKQSGSFDRMIELFGVVQAEGVAEAADDPEWEYDGTYSAWFASAALREQGDLAGIRRLAETPLVDPMERASLLGIAAQMESAAGNGERARVWADEAEQSLLAANAKRSRRPDAYFPDATSAVPEVVAARWLVDGRAPALAAGETWAAPYADEELDWKAAAAVHAAAALRRRGDTDDAKTALDTAAAALNRTPDLLLWDARFVAREMVAQGRADEAEATLHGSDHELFNLGWAWGLAEGAVDAATAEP